MEAQTVMAEEVAKSTWGPRAGVGEGGGSIAVRTENRPGYQQLGELGP